MTNLFFFSQPIQKHGETPSILRQQIGLHVVKDYAGRLLGQRHVSVGSLKSEEDFGWLVLVSEVDQEPISSNSGGGLLCERAFSDAACAVEP